MKWPEAKAIPGQGMAQADCEVMKDIATHTCIGPNHRHLVFKKFLEYVNQCPKAEE